MKSFSVLLSFLSLGGVVAFAPNDFRSHQPGHMAPLMSSSSTDATTTSPTTSLSLEKPLGVILEENEEGVAAGVFVKEVGDGGSAAAHAETILGCKLFKVQGADVTQASFDDVMDAIIGAPDVVELEFEAKAEPDFAVGTVVTVVAEQNGKDDLVFEAKVGDNLRKALLDNGFEVYQGMKQKLGNCGGGGTCTFCAVDIIESEGWPARSDYEDQKLRKNPQARLACLNPIQGPVKLRKADR